MEMKKLDRLCKIWYKYAYRNFINHFMQRKGGNTMSSIPKRDLGVIGRLDSETLGHTMLFDTSLALCLGASVFVGATIFVLLRKKAIESIGELRFMKQEAEKRKKVIEESYGEKGKYQTQIYVAEYLDRMKAEKERIQHLEEKIRNHWGWKVLNPKKVYF